MSRSARRRARRLSSCASSPVPLISMLSGMSGKVPSDLAEGRDGEVVGGEPVGRRDVTGADAAVDVGIVWLVRARAAFRREPVGVVEGRGARRSVISATVPVPFVVRSTVRSCWTTSTSSADDRDVEVEHVDAGGHALAEGEHRRSRVPVLAAGVGEHDGTAEVEQLVDRRRRLVERGGGTRGGEDEQGEGERGDGHEVTISGPSASTRGAARSWSRSQARSRRSWFQR